MGLFVGYGLSLIQRNILYSILAGVGALATLYSIHRVVRVIYVDDEYFTKVTWHGGVAERRVLVLGLDGAGKSRLLQCFQPGLKPGDILPDPEPSIAFNIRSAGIAGIDYHFWDVNGLVSRRTKWMFQFLYDIDVLLWLVDGSNPERLCESKTALHDLIEALEEQEDEFRRDMGGGGESYYGVPIVIVVTKQDKTNSLSPRAVYDHLAVEKFANKHKVYLIGTHIPSQGHRKGLWRVYELISFATKKRYHL